MNEKQKKILIAVAAGILGMFLYPPFQFKNSGGRVFSRGYGWITDGHGALMVDFSTLVAQWFVVLIIGGVAFMLVKDK